MKNKMSIIVFFTTLFLLFVFGLFTSHVFAADAMGDEFILIDGDVAEQANKHLERTEKLYIEDVLEGGPADKAGLQKGDQILAIDDEPVAKIEHIVTILDAHSPDDRLKMTIQREDETLDFEVILGKNEEEKAFLGVVLAFEMTIEELKEVEESKTFPKRLSEWLNRWVVRYGTPDSETPAPEVASPPSDFDEAELPEGQMLQGAIVREVIADSPAEAAGLQENDVITAINGQPVDSLETYYDLLRAQPPNEKMELTVARHEESEPLTIEVTPAEKSDNTAYLGVQAGFVWRVEHTEGTLPEGFDEDEFFPEMPTHPFDDELPAPPGFRPPPFGQMPTPPEFPRPPFGELPKPPRFP